MQTNGSLTVYNKRYDPIGRRNVYYRTVITDIMWMKGAFSRSLANNERLADVKATIYITLEKVAGSYLTPAEWQALETDEERSAKFTLQNGDWILKGEAAEELTNIFTVTNLKNLYEVLEVKDVDSKDYGPLPLQHLKVFAK